MTESSAQSDLTLEPVNLSLRGEMVIPPDKSISHRALILGALAAGESRIHHLLPAADVLATQACLQALGVEIHCEMVPGTTQWQASVVGKGLRGLQQPHGILPCGNSGTTMRLLMGVLAGYDWRARLAGDSSLNRRPMGRVMDPLARMGAHFEMAGEGSAARVITEIGHCPLRPLDYTMPLPSAQVKASVLLAGLTGQAAVRLYQPALCRDHTERMLVAMGVDLTVLGNEIEMVPPETLSPLAMTVPGDFSSAAFWLVAALIVPGSELILRNVGANPTRTGLLKVLNRMGANYEWLATKVTGGEPVGDLVVRSSFLQGATIDEGELGLLIDEIPIFAVLAACAHGRSQVSGARELRVKESDRISGIVQGLQALGVELVEQEDGFVITGPQGVRGGIVDSLHDHRLAMAFAILSLVAQGPITIRGADCVNISYPDFFADRQRLFASSL